MNTVLTLLWICLVFLGCARLDRRFAKAEDDQAAFGLSLVILLVGAGGAMANSAMGKPLPGVWAFIITSGLAMAAIWGIRIQRIRAKQGSAG